MMEELFRIDAMGQAELVRRGEVSARELVDAAIHRLAVADERLKVLAGTDFEAARRRAMTSPKGPLGGVPFLVKDLTPYPGLRHSMGCRLFAQNFAGGETPLSKRFDEAGLIVLGKTTTSELGLLGSTETLLEGATRNPWAPSRSAGGSSGGSAAAVASRLVPMAHASDGGGSIRIPAAMNGVFGLKPSARRTVFSGIDDMNGLLVEHAVSVSVRDSALLLSLTEQPVPGCAPVGFVEGPSRERMRIGVYRATLMNASPSPSTAEALDQTAALCRDLGHEVVETAPPPIDGPAVSEAFFTIAAAGLHQLAQQMKAVLGRAVGPDDLEPFTLALIEGFGALGPDALARAVETVARCEAQMKAFLVSFDVVLCPTTPIELPPLGWLAPTLPRETLIARTEQLAGYTPVHNMAKVPAMSLPLAWSDEGLPIGSHFAAPFGEEAKLLRLAYELEAASPWRERHPSMASDGR